MSSDVEQRLDGPSPDGPRGGSALRHELDAQAAFADRLDTMSAGASLLSVLENLDLEQLNAFERVEVVAAAGRVEARAHALKARAALAVDRHPDLRRLAGPTPRGTASPSQDVTAATLAMRLQVTEREAGLLVREGRAYDGVLADTGAALADGRIDVPRARAFVRRVADQPVPVATAVQDAVLPRAPGRTTTHVQTDIERALQQVDGEHTAHRHRKARAERTVARPSILQDGMAGTWVVLPAVHAVQVDTALDTAARRARAVGDPRTIGQLRTDELLDRVLGPGTRVVAPDGSAVPSRRDGAHADLASLGVVLAGADPACDAPGERNEQVDGPSGPDASSGGASRTPRTSVHVVVALSTLLGADDAPGDLAGYGPIDAAQARALALELGSTWRRIVVDDLSGTVLDVGRTSYRPPAALAEHVRHRDRYCAAPGCPVPSWRCDLDHTVEFHPPPDGSPRPLGSTCADNLGPLCRPHHELKTAGALRVRQPTAGTFDWETPSGHRIRVQPGSDAAAIHLTAPPARPGPHPRPPALPL